MTQVAEEKLRLSIEKEAKRIEEDAEYSGKGHYNACSSWSRRHLWIGIPAAVLAALASGSAFKDFSLVAGILAILSTGFGTVATFLNPSRKSESHKSSGDQFLALRNQTRLFREVELPQMDNLGVATERIKEFAKKRDQLNAISPSIPNSAYRYAKEAIEAGESLHRADAGKGC